MKNALTALIVVLSGSLTFAQENGPLVSFPEEFRSMYVETGKSSGTLTIAVGDFEKLGKKDVFLELEVRAESAAVEKIRLKAGLDTLLEHEGRTYLKLDAAASIEIENLPAGRGIIDIYVTTNPKSAKRSAQRVLLSYDTSANPPVFWRIATEETLVKAPPAVKPTVLRKRASRLVALDDLTLFRAQVARVPQNATGHRIAFREEGGAVFVTVLDANGTPDTSAARLTILYGANRGGIWKTIEVYPAQGNSPWVMLPDCDLNPLFVTANWYPASRICEVNDWYGHVQLGIYQLTRTSVPKYERTKSRSAER